MKILAIAACLSGLGMSAFASEGKLYQCNLKKMKAKLEVKVSGSQSQFRFITPEEPKPQFQKTLQSFDVPKQQILSDPFLAKIVRAAGVRDLQNVFKARVYITDSNNLGMSGLMVVQAGPGATEFQSFFAAGADLALTCNR